MPLGQPAPPQEVLMKNNAGQACGTSLRNVLELLNYVFFHGTKVIKGGNMGEFIAMLIPLQLYVLCSSFQLSQEYVQSIGKWPKLLQIQEKELKTPAAYEIRVISRLYTYHSCSNSSVI